MPRSTRELIGEIINPPPRKLPDPQQPLSTQPIVAVSALIGWTIGPPGGRIVPAPAPAVSEAASPAAARPAEPSRRSTAASHRRQDPDHASTVPLPPF